MATSGLSIYLAALGLQAEAAQPASRNRADIPAQYRWDFSAIYPGWDAWEAAMKELEAKMDAFAALKGSLARGAAQLLKAYRALDEIVGTFYTQVLFADFELQAHRLAEQGSPITSEVLNNLYLGLLRDYYGDSLTVDDAYKYTWTRIPHFYNSPYYVYQYATCFASSAKLFRDMTAGEPAVRKAATERYLALLRSGGNDQPMKQLQKAGVDLTQRATVQTVIDQMTELVARMEAEAARIR